MLELAAGGAEVAFVALEDDIFAQLAVERTVHEAHLLGRRQADLLEVFLAIADDPGVPAGEDVLQPRAYSLIESVHVGSGDALAVGGIGDKDAGRHGRLGPLGYGLDFQVDIAADAGAADVAAGDVDGCRGDVGADDGELDGTLGRVVVPQTLEELGVEVGPMFEGEVLAVDAGHDVGGDEGGLDEERSGAAHGVDEGTLAAVAAHEDYAGGEHLGDGRLGLGRAVAALVETLAARVETERDVAAVDVDVDDDVGIGQTHARTLVAVAVAEPVDDGVLDAVCDIARVLERVGVHHRVDGERLVERHETAPVELLDAVVERVGVVGLERVERLEDTQGRAAAEISLVKRLQVAAERDHAPAGGDVFGAEGTQLVGQDGLQTLQRLGDHLEFLFHHVS